MPRNSIAPDGKTVRTSVMLPEDVHCQVQTLAEANSVSSAWIIRRAVEKFLIEHKGQLDLPLSLSGSKGLMNK